MFHKLYLKILKLYKRSIKLQFYSSSVIIKQLQNTRQLKKIRVVIAAGSSVGSTDGLVARQLNPRCNTCFQQQKSFSVIMSGRDMMGIAQTGTGKTLAYLLPLLKLYKLEIL